MSEWLPTRKVAEHYGVEMSTVQDWWQQGKLPEGSVQRLGGGTHGRLVVNLRMVEEAWAASRGPSAGGKAPTTPSKRPALGLVSGSPTTPNQGGRDA